MSWVKALVVVLLAVVAASFVAGAALYALGFRFTRGGLVRLAGRGAAPALKELPAGLPMRGTPSEGGALRSLSAPSSGGSALTYAARMVIREGRVVVEVEEGSLEEALRRLRGACAELGGYIAESKVVGGRAYVVAKVPSERMEEFVEEVRKLGRVVSEETSTRDVTEQYVDLEARLRNARRQEQRLLEILSMAKTVEEVLKVEEHLKRVREEIERLEAYKRYLERRVEYATVQVELREVRGREVEWPEFDVVPALVVGLNVIYTSIYVLIVVAMFCVVAVPVALLLCATYRSLKRGRLRGLLARIMGGGSE